MPSMLPTSRLVSHPANRPCDTVVCCPGSWRWPTQCYCYVHCTFNLLLQASLVRDTYSLDPLLSNSAATRLPQRP